MKKTTIALLITLVSLIVVPGIAHTWARAQAAQDEPEARPRAAEDAAPAVPATELKPKHESAQSLFKKWQDSARINGNIPGGALRSLARATTNYVEGNPTDELSPKLAKLHKQIDTSRDWTQADAVALLDDVTAICADLPKWARDERTFSTEEAIQTGQPLPEELEDAPWGEAQPNGLRAAWLLQPRAEQYRLGTALKSSVLFHNAGTSAVVFRALKFNQYGHKARDAKGAEIMVLEAWWTTPFQSVACRLAPGEYTEVTAAGIGVGIGANKEHEDWPGTHVGSWIEAKEGDEVTFIPAPVPASGRPDDELFRSGPLWWLDFIADRLSRDMPLPDDDAERERLLDRAIRDLFGTAPTPEETAAFVADRSPDAMKALANRLAKRAGTTSFTGTLQSGETKFRVLPVNPDAAKKPRAPIVIKASEVLENLKKYDSIYESGFSVSGSLERKELLFLDSDYSIVMKSQWTLTSSAGRFVYRANVIDYEKPDYQQLGGPPSTMDLPPGTIVAPPPGQADGQDENAAAPGVVSIRTKRWGYWGSDAAGHFFEDKAFQVTPENEMTEISRRPKVSIWGPMGTSSDPARDNFLWALGRMFSKTLDEVTRAEESEDGLLIVSALGKNLGQQGRWELEIEPGAAWLVRKARFYSNARPESITAEMANSGTVWSGSYCIPKEAKISLFNPISGGARHLTFDPVVGKFDEKLYSDVREAVVSNKEPTLELHDYRVSPPTTTEPNKPKPEHARD